MARLSMGATLWSVPRHSLTTSSLTSFGFQLPSAPITIESHVAWTECHTSWKPNSSSSRLQVATHAADLLIMTWEQLRSDFHFDSIYVLQAFGAVNRSSYPRCGRSGQRWQLLTLHPRPPPLLSHRLSLRRLHLTLLWAVLDAQTALAAPTLEVSGSTAMSDEATTGIHLYRYPCASTRHSSESISRIGITLSLTCGS